MSKKTSPLVLTVSTEQVYGRVRLRKEHTSTLRELVELWHQDEEDEIMKEQFEGFLLVLAQSASVEDVISELGNEAINDRSTTISGAVGE